MQINKYCWIELFVLEKNTWNHLVAYRQMINVKLNYYYIAILKTI